MEELQIKHSEDGKKFLIFREKFLVILIYVYHQVRSLINILKN